jgi:hypothetical protein
MAEAHIVAAIPNGTYVECIHPDHDRIVGSLASNRPKFANGLHLGTREVGSGMELEKHSPNGYRA